MFLSRYGDKTYLFSVYGALLGVDVISFLLGWPWELFGAAFAGATVFLFAEAAKQTPTKRSVGQKANCVLIGTFFGSLLATLTSKIIANKLDVPEADMPWVYAGLWGAVSYRVYAISQRRLPKSVHKLIDKVDKLTDSDEPE